MLHAAASKHSGKHSSTPGYALLLWSLFAVCVCDRWRERGLPFWSGSRQTHENGPYSKFRTGITTFFFFSCFCGLFLYTVLDKCETSTFSRLHTCSSNFMSCFVPVMADITCFLWYIEVSLGKYWTLYFPWCFHCCVTLWVKVKVQRSKFCMIGKSATRQDKLMKTDVNICVTFIPAEV